MWGWLCVSVLCVCVRLFVFSFWLDFTIFSAQSSIDHCCRYLVGDSAKIMASTLLNVAHDVALIVSHGRGVQEGRREGADGGGGIRCRLQSWRLHRECLSVRLSRVSRKLNCLGNCKVILSAPATGAQCGAWVIYFAYAACAALCS